VTLKGLNGFGYLHLFYRMTVYLRVYSLHPLVIISCLTTYLNIVFSHEHPQGVNERNHPKPEHWLRKFPEYKQKT